jgi:hypothetical protein
MARVLTFLDAPLWRAVRELYLTDLVVEALQEAERLGGQDSNDLYAEAEVRSSGSQRNLRDWLSLEAIESEVPHNLSEVSAIVARECEALSDRFGWDHREHTLVSLLPKDVEAPWMPGRWGYFVDKEPYDKICLPYHLTIDLPNLRRTIQHEFMHVITWNLTDGHAPRWLSEAMSTYAEDRLDAAVWKGLKTGSANWMTLSEVDALVSADNRDEKKRAAISFAYTQANLVARYLAATGGDPKIGVLLRAIGDESFLHNLEGALLARSRTDSALRRIYGISEHDLFVLALEWVRATPIPAIEP